MSMDSHHHRLASLDDAAFSAKVLEICRELVASRIYPSFNVIRLRLKAAGVGAANSRILAVRDAAFAAGELGPWPLRLAKVKPKAADALYRVPEEPKQSTPPPSEGAAKCWEDRRAFWRTMVGRRTRKLLLRPKPRTQEVTP